MKRFFLFCAMTMLAAMVHSRAADSPATDALVRIEIAPGQARIPIADDFIGFGYETSATALPGYFSATNSHLIALYQTLTRHGLVRIGGNVSDHTKYEPNGIAQANSEKATTIINDASLKRFGEFLRATGWRAMWGLNLGTGTKEEAVQEAMAVQAALGDRLQSFEIGNEVDLLRRFKTYESYYSNYLDYKAAIRAALPESKFSGPDVAGKIAWASNFAQTESKDMALLTHHYYRSGAMRADATIETLLGTDSKWENTLQKLQEISAEHQVAFRINEVNSFYGGGKAGVSDTFASALWCLDYMFTLASHGCQGVNMETDVNQLGFVSHYSPIFRDTTGKLSARPEYMGMLAFALVGKGDLVKLAVAETNINLRAYATITTDFHPWIIIVNKDFSRNAKVEIVTPHPFNKAGVYRLRAGSLESHDGVTLAGAEVSSDGTWTPRPMETTEINDKVVRLTVPSASAALVRLE